MHGSWGIRIRVIGNRGLHLACVSVHQMRQRTEAAGDAFKVHEGEEAPRFRETVPVMRERDGVETFLVGADVVDHGKALSPAGAVAFGAIGGGVLWWDDGLECCCAGGSSGEKGGDQGAREIHGCCLVSLFKDGYRKE